MAKLILFIVLIFEIAFAINCIVTKQNHSRINNWIRIAIFIAFVILAISPVIVWDYRWAMPGILFLVLAVKATVSLIRKKENKKYKTYNIVLKSIIIILVTAVALAPAIVFPQHKSIRVTGDYKVATATYTYTDKSRVEEFTDTEQHRFLNVKFWYPKNGKGTYPLLVFSHGAFGIKDSNSSTYTELASHGYVVVSIDHPYHSFYTRSEDGTVIMINSDFSNEVENMNKGFYSTEERYNIIQKWMKLRTDDMNFVINTILEKAQNDNTPLYQHISTEKIGVFGHSMGGAASVSLGRERDDVGAVVNIDAPFYSELVYNKADDSFVASSRAYTAPIFNIYSDDVWRQLDSTPVYVANKLNNKQFEGAYTTHFKGAKHLSLTDLQLFSPILANMLHRGKPNIDPYYCIEMENKLILEFFDYELKGIGQFNPKRTY